jgi:hypothetical protein
MKPQQVPLGTIPEGFVYRDQSKRNPWWVKSVDRITTELDESTIQRKDDLFGYGSLPKKQLGSWWQKKLPIGGIDTRRR